MVVSKDISHLHLVNGRTTLVYDLVFARTAVCWCAQMYSYIPLQRRIATTMSPKNSYVLTHLNRRQEPLLSVQPPASRTGNRKSHRSRRWRWRWDRRHRRQRRRKSMKSYSWAEAGRSWPTQRHVPATAGKDREGPKWPWALRRQLSWVEAWNSLSYRRLKLREWKPL